MMFVVSQSKVSSEWEICMSLINLKTHVNNNRGYDWLEMMTTENKKLLLTIEPVSMDMNTTA